ncbi:protein NDR1 [Lactuca sativa]|uniref:protein NDR1 n=1 Tax=Lactuca sativa TaxID=4236 RepID=UPI000CB63214|nr:protein NDR1 [Lactuca sativa]
MSGYFTVLLLSRNRPTIYLDNFNIVSLRNTSSSSTNTAIYLELRVQNENSWIGVYYEDPLNLTITYLQSTISTGSNVIIERSTIKGFYQGNGEVKHIQASVVIQDLFSTTERPRRLGETNIMMYGPSKMIDFVIDLEADIKFKSIENKKSHLTMQSTVEVSDYTGTSVLKTIQMKYTSGSNKWGVWRWVLAVPLVSLIQGLLSLAFLLAFLFLSFVSLV